MKRLLAVVAVLSCTAGADAQFAPPSAEAEKQVQVRRKHLEVIGAWFNRPVVALEDAQIDRAMKLFDEALRSPDAHVFGSAVSDLLNGNYIPFPPEKVLQLLLPRLKTPETAPERMPSQAFIMEYLGRRFGPKAKEALPDLLRIVTDIKLPAYLRRSAIDPAAKIGPGDETVVAAFTEALTSPHPKSESGVHDLIAERLGEMGKAAWPAKEAIAGLFVRGEWYEDYAFIALGKLAMDETPRALHDYLDVLGKIDKLPLEEAAAAFLHIQKLAHPKAAIRPPHVAALTPLQAEVTRAISRPDETQAKQARPVLLKIIVARTGNDVYVRAALRTLWALGPGGTPQAARVLTDVLTRQPLAKTHDAREEARAALARFEASDKAAVPILADGLDRILKETPYDWRSCRTVAELLSRYGKDARPAVPALSRAVERYREPLPNSAWEELGACADALAVAGADVPEAQTILLRLLDPEGTLLKKAGPAAPSIQARLLLAVGKMELPTAGEARDALLDRIRGGLASDRAVVFSAAASVVNRNGRAFAEKESASLVPLLVRTLATGVQFKEHDTPGSAIAVRFPDQEAHLIGKAMAPRALGAMGPAARAALPHLERVAAQPLVNVKGTYLPEPPFNHVIREAREAVKQIRADR